MRRRPVLTDGAASPPAKAPPPLVHSRMALVRGEGTSLPRAPQLHGRPSFGIWPRLSDLKAPIGRFEKPAIHLACLQHSVTPLESAMTVPTSAVTTQTFSRA